MSKCVKCSKAVKEGVLCCMCECVFHTKCIGLTDDVVVSLNSLKNVKIVCDGCMKSFDNVKSLLKVENMSAIVEKLSDINSFVKRDLTDLKVAVEECAGKIGMMMDSDLKVK